MSYGRTSTANACSLVSAKNGGRGTPPVPPPSHAPPQEVPISRETRWPSQQTEAERVDDGAVISFLILDGGQVVRHSYMIGEQGKKRLLEELSGGLQLP